MVKNIPADAGEMGLIPESGRPPDRGHGNPLQYSCLKNPMDRGAWLSMGSQRVGHDWAHTHTQYHHLIGPCVGSFTMILGEV